MNEIVYLPNQDETAIAFVKRVVAEQSDREPLRIVTASKQRFTLALRHGGKPIDNRMIWLMDDHIDRAKYKSDGDDWVLTLRRDIPSFYISHEKD